MRQGAKMDERSSVYYIVVGGSQEGPFSFSQLVDAVAAGRLKDQDRVWRPGMPAWVPAASIPGLYAPPPLIQDEPRDKEQASQIPAAPVEAIPDTQNGQTPPVVAPDIEATAAQKRKPNYFIRHWRGDLGLGISYWLNGFLLNIAGLAIVGAYVAYSRSATDDGLVKSFVILNGIIVLMIVLSVWQYVGVWRSASKSPGRGGSRLWAVLAKTMVIFGVLRFVGEFSTEIAPVYSRYTEILFVEEPAKTLTVSPILGGTVINFDGEIKIGAHSAFREALEAAPQATIVRLTSNGGWLSEADAIGRDIRDRKLQTVITSHCASACSHLFLSGSRRWMTDGAQLGFHAPASSITNETDTSDIDKERRALTALGMPETMAVKAANTPHSSMWYPTGIEMQNAKLIDGLIDRAAFNSTGAIKVVSVEDLIKEELLKLPVIAAVQLAEPAIFEKMVQQATADISKGMKPADAGTRMGPLVKAVVKKYLPRASDSLVLRMAAINLQYMERWQKDDVMSCVAFSDPDKAPDKVVNPGVYKDISAEELGLQPEIIRSGQRDMVPVPKEDEIMDDLVAILRKVDAVQPGAIALLDKARLSPSELAPFCRMNIEFYRQVATLPRAAQAKLFRHIFASL